MMKMSNNFYGTLGLASRARKIVDGETLIQSIRAKKVHFVIIANDASENTKKKITDKCKTYHVDYVIYSDSIALSNAIGKDNRVAIGIIDSGFSKKIKNEIGRWYYGKAEEKSKRK